MPKQVVYKRTLDIEIIDEVLELLYTNPYFVSVDEIKSVFKGKYENAVFINNFATILNKLEKDGFIIKELKSGATIGDYKLEPDYYKYCISYDGILFYNIGGYEEYAKRENQDRENKIAYDTLMNEQVQSTIDTNGSVKETNTALINNIPTQNRLTRASVFVSFVSLAFIIATVYKDYTDTTSEELKGIKIQLEEYTKAFQSQAESRDSFYQLQQNKGIDSTNN